LPDVLTVNYVDMFAEFLFWNYMDILWALRCLLSRHFLGRLTMNILDIIAAYHRWFVGFRKVEFCRYIVNGLIRNIYIYIYIYLSCAS
jgi:hypothetical protein